VLLKERHDKIVRGGGHGPSAVAAASHVFRPFVESGQNGALRILFRIHRNTSSTSIRTGQRSLAVRANRTIYSSARQNVSWKSSWVGRAPLAPLTGVSGSEVPDVRSGIRRDP
jgi:hypothetical protein